MEPDRWQEVERIYHAALQREPSERSSYLDQSCAGNPTLRAEVESLLKYTKRPGSFLNAPALEVAAQALADTLRAEDGVAPDRMIGAGIEQYRITAKIGTGGMGEVYRARDLRLGREVAIKVLPFFFSADSDRLRRFEQEAQAAAALNHPNILVVYEMGTHDGAPYLVSELLDGETLREPIKRGRLSVRKAIDYGVQIARGLTAAHEKGIIHRDLKPENLFVTKEGRVKILDFGLAKLMQPQSSSEHSAATLTEGTEAGAVMGTVGYMAPEQVRGQTVDHRADIFAFGAILYEMLAGVRAFQKPTSADTMSAILNEDPSGISQISKNVPPALLRVVHRCLEKNPEQRFQSASDLAFALDALSETSSSSAILSGKAPWKLSRFWVVSAALVAVVAAVFILRSRSQRPQPKHELVESQLTANPVENSVGSWVISRDGKYIAYTDFLSKNLYLLAIDSGEIRQLSLPGQYQPVDWFPDGNHLLLWSAGLNGSLWKLSTWDSSLRKLWSGNAAGEAVSPDGSHIAFVKDNGGVWLMESDGEEPREILKGDGEFMGSIAWSPTGQRLAYIRNLGPFAKRQVTIETCDLAGGARTAVLSDPNIWGYNGIGTIAWLPDGRIVYSTSTSMTGDRDLWAVTADAGTGKPSGVAARLAGWKNFDALDPQASADGKRLIASRVTNQREIYIGSLAPRGKPFTPHRFTPDGWYNEVGAWTNDSKAILFSSKHSGRWTIYRQDIGAETPTTLIAGAEHYWAPILSPEGTVLYLASAAPDEANDATIRLMSTPVQGGARSTLMTGHYGYACGSAQSSSCVAAELKDKQLIFYYLDPVKGRGDEIARFAEYQSLEPRFSLSPDAARIAIVDPSEEVGKIRILNLADRKVAVLSVRDWKVLQEIGWAADGKSLFALAPSASSYAILSIDGKAKSKILYQFPVGSAWIDGIVPSPDGRSLAFTKRTFVNDVMLLENF